MKKINWLIFMLGVFFMTSISLYSAENDNRFGIGVSLGKELLLWSEGYEYALLDFPCFYFPIKFFEIFTGISHNKASSHCSNHNLGDLLSD